MHLVNEQGLATLWGKTRVINWRIQQSNLVNQYKHVEKNCSSSATKNAFKNNNKTLVVVR